MAREAAMTCSIKESPPARCSTLARLDFIRVPRPAARITTLICEFILTVSAPDLTVIVLREPGSCCVPRVLALPIVVQRRRRRVDRGERCRRNQADRWPLFAGPFRQDGRRR